MKNILKIVKKKFLYNILIIRPRLMNNFSLLDIWKIPNFINVNKITPLCEVMVNKGTDKAMYSGKSKHNYTPIYHAFFNKLRNKKIRLLEVGIGTNNINIDSNMGPDGKPGASLKGWKEYFEFGEIFGADLDEAILFEEDRIKTFYCDQTNSDSINLMFNKNIELFEQFDLIIDDGLHTFEANRILLESSIHKLKSSGIYVIEDVINSEIEKWKLFLSKGEIKKNRIKFLILKVPNFLNKYDNNLIIIKKSNL